MLFKFFTDIFFFSLLKQKYLDSEQKFIENGYDGKGYNFICDLNTTDDECRTALYLAVANGHTLIVEYLTNVFFY